MLPLPRGAIWQLLFLFCAALYINGVRADGRVVCYYTNWSVYRPGTAKFNPQNINPYLCTHLIYAFGGFTKDNQMKPFDKYQDIEQGGYAKFTGLKTYNKQLKTMIAIGGWNEASSRFSPLVANSERRQKFIKNILKFLRQNHFDGIDLDWEYPAHREGGKPRDRDNYAQFVQELRAEFERESEKTGRPRLLLTMAVPAGIEYIEKGYDIPKLNKYLDWFNLLTYDFHSSHEPSVNHHAPLYSLEEESEYNYDAELNIDYSIKFYLNAGADRDKLVLGIPTYGRSFTLINEESTEIGAPAEAPGDQGDATREKGYLAYYEICQNLKEDPEWTVVQPNPNAMGPYAYRRNQWVGYDDEAIVRKKAQYVVDNGLGGIMFWAIDNDDFRGTCTGKPYPLIEAAKDAMLDALGLGINEVSKPSAPQKPSRSRSRENSSSTRNRITTTEHKLTYAERKGSSKRTQSTQQTTRNRQQSTTTTTTAAPLNIKLTEAEGSSLYVGGRTTTPPPPTTPDPGTDFKCEEEGFFQHPRDCKKYYWCLDSGPSGLGIVAHQFTCPSGLYFNPAADSCDFARNVPCKSKKSTTAAPITSPATTTTTPRPTSSFNRITAATSRPTTFFRTTPRTTTTTEAPEEEIEYEEEDDNPPSPFAKPKGFDKESEEDPKVIKELIELIRKVGGIEELEKHLLRKDDGTIAIKENSSSSSSTLVATTPSSISKSLYEKVLSKPNALSSFRNRFTSTSSFRTTKTQVKTQDSTEAEEAESHETDSKSSGASAGFSKYSSVLRGNSRQGPQSEGLEKLSEFDGFLKEKKQYTTINRNRGVKKTSTDEDEDDISSKTSDESQDDEAEEEVSVKSTRRPYAASTPAYSTIRRTRPSATTEATDEEEQEEKDVSERKSYSSLNRSRLRGTTTTELPDVTEVTAGSSRYKYLERTRPTRPTTESTNKVTEEEDIDGDNESENQENTVHFKAVNIENTRETQQEITTNTQRTYASIGRRTTTSTTATPETETTTSAAKTRLTTTTAATPTTTTTSTTETPITTPLTILETTTPESILITTNIPITTTTNPTTTTTSTTMTTTTSSPNDEDVLESLTTTTPPNLNEISSDNSETLNLSQNINSLLTDSTTTTTSSSNSTPTPTTESGLDTNEQEIDSQLTTTETTLSTTTTINDSDNLTKTEDKEQEEVNLVSKQRNKTLYTTRTRTTTTTLPPTTTTNSVIETTPSPTNAKKPLGVRRQQILLNRSSQTKTTTSSVTTTDIPTTTTTESVNNDFLGTVSSPRPFGFPKRRNRPNNAAGLTTTEETVVKSNDESLVTKQKTTKLNAAANSQTKVSSHNTILSQTATAHEAATSSQQEHIQQEESEVTGTEHLSNSKLDTKVENFHKHVVVTGIEDNNDNNLRHVNNVNVVNVDSINNSAPKIHTHTIVQEVDDDDDEDPQKQYTWRDARRPTKPTPKKKKLVVTEVTTEERVRQSVSPNHVSVVNVVETNEKDSRYSKKQEDLSKETGKYRGKSLESSVDSDSVEQNHVDDEEDEGRAFRTYTSINRRRQQTTTQSAGIGNDEETNVNGFRVTQVVKSGGDSEEDSLNSKFKYSTITRGQTTKTGESKSESSQESEDGLKTKFKYTTLTRGSQHSGSQADNDENDDKQAKTSFKYTKITRGQGSQGDEHEEETTESEHELKTKYTTITRGSTTKTATGSQTSNAETKITRGHGSESVGHEEETSNSQASEDKTASNSFGSTSSQEGEDGLKTKFKYSIITRGSTTATASGTQSSNDESDDNQTTRFKYTKITRGQGSQTVGHEEETSDDSSVTNKHKYTILNRGHSADEDNSNNGETDGTTKSKTTFQYTKITRGQGSQAAESEKETSNSQASDDSSVTNKHKYTTLNRGHSAEGNSNNADTDDTTNTSVQYTKITRGHSKYEEDTEGVNDKTKTYTTLNRNRGSSLYSQDNSEYDSSESDSDKKSYTTITRNRGSGSTTENIPYKAIVRDSQGVHLTEGELSGFVKHAGDAAVTETSKITYHTISRGGQILENGSNEETEDKHLQVNAIETMSLTQIEKTTENQQEQAEAELTAEIEEEQSSTSEVETTTTTEKPVITTTTTEATTTTTEATTTTEKELPSSTEEVIIENTTVYVAPETTSTTPEPTTRRSFFKNRTSTETNIKETEIEVEKSTRGNTKQQVTTTQTGRRRVVFRKRPTSVTSQATINRETVETKQASEDTKVKQVSEGTSGATQTQTSFRRRTIVAKRPTLTEDSEAKLKFDRGSLLNTASESSIDDLDSTTRPSLSRGTYRPKEKGDLSSLLALDYAKKYGYNSQQQFGNGKRRRPVERIQSADENEEDSVTRTRISGSTSEEINANKSQQQFGNGKRKRPVQRPQSADENEEDSITRTRISGSTSEEINSNSEAINGGSSTITTKKRIFSSKTSGSGTINSSETTENSQLKSSGSALKGDTQTLIDESSGLTLNRGEHETAENGDVSTLLASDVAKKQGNKSQFAFGTGAKRISQVQTSTQTGSETENNGRTRINSSTNQQGTSVTETVNGRRRTIIRKRIQSTKTAGTGNTLGSRSTLISANQEGNSESLLKHSGHNENESTVSSGTSSGSVSKFNSNTDEKQANILENSNTTSETSTETEHQILANNDDSSSNSNTKSKFNLNAKQATTGTLKTNTYNSLNRKNAFANKRVTGSQSGQNTQSGKQNTVTETETIETLEEESDEDQNSLNNNISSTSGSKFKSRNSLTHSQTLENSRKSNFSGRRGSLNTRLQNKNNKTEKVEILEDGSKRITTTYIETINEGGKVKTIKRTKIKTIIQEAPEYEYETDETTITATTRRPIPLNRGSARFQSNDLSSLLALDIASKSNKRVEGDRTLTKTRRKLIRKPAIVKEEEHIEEFEEDLPTRPPRPASTTEAPQGINRRTRPTRPLRTSTRTTQTAEEDNEEEEEVVATTRRNFALKRPTARPTTRSPVTKETAEEVESTTRRAFAFKRPVGSVKTITTTTTNEETSEDNATAKRIFAFKRPVGSVKTITTTTTNEQTTEDDSTTKRAFAFKRPVGSVKTITTTTTTEQISQDDATAKRDFAFKRPASSGRTITTTEEVSKTSITESEQGNESLNLFKSKTATATEATEELSTTTNEPVTTESSTSETTTEQYIETTTVPQLAHDPLDTLNNQLSEAVQSLKTETEKVTETEVMDAFETKNEITSGLTSGQDLSLPIYHRRKYYQYYKDSPIIHINPITLAPDNAVDTNVDIAKQIHEVFNVSNDHFQPEPEPDDVIALKAMEQAQEINAELSHFLLNTPGSK